MTPGDAWRWWTGALATLIPPRLRTALAPEATTLVASRHGDGVALTLRGPGRVRAMGTLGAPGQVRWTRHRVALAIPAAEVLTRRVDLPLAAERDLYAVMAFEMDRLTPFALEDVAFAAETVARRPSQGRIDVALTFAPLGPHREVLAALAAAGLPVDWLETAGGDGPALRLRLPGAAPRRHRGVLPRLAVAGAVVGAALLVTWAVLAQMQLARTAAVLRAEATALRQAALAAQVAEEDSVGADAAAHALALKQARPMAVAILGAVADALPDDAFLTSARLGADDLELSGYAADAAGLLPRFAAAAGFDAPRFAAPITRDPGATRERFVLVVRIAPGDGIGVGEIAE